jgi:hypothetical protein
MLELQARQPGSREFLRISVDYDGIEEKPKSFNLVVQRLSRPGSQLVEDQEIFADVSIDPADDRCIADLIKASRLVTLRGALPERRPDVMKPGIPGHPVPFLDAAVQGSDGVEVTDYDVIGSNKHSTGLFSLDAINRIDLLCLPPPPGRDHGVTTFLAAERYCERRRALLIWDPPRSWDSAATALLEARRNELQSRNALTYFPRIRPRLERVGLPSMLPACGAIAGILSNKAAYGEWQESSPTDPLLRISLAPSLEMTKAEEGSLNRYGVNVLRATQAGGAAFHGNVTLAPRDGSYRLWRRLDRRRLMGFILESIERVGTELAEHAGSPAEEFEVLVTRFLDDLRMRGALVGEARDRAFAVRAIAGARAGTSRLRVGIALDKPGEFLLYDFDLGGDGCVARAVPVLEAEQLAG